MEGEQEDVKLFRFLLEKTGASILCLIVSGDQGAVINM